MQEKNMAGSGPSNNDYFYPGSTVKCTTCYGDDIQGEVTAFDHDTKILILKQPSSCGKAELNNVTMLNLDLIQSVSVIKECTDTPLPTLASLNSLKLLDRYKEEIELKMALAKARSVGVSNDGIKLYNFLRKTMPDCRWTEQTILVMDEVVVKPPYQPDNCAVKDTKQSHSSPSQCLNHVKNIVERFHKEERLKSHPHGT
ncbi:protein LSM12 homolog A-like [Clavelina lepadiformis]|uniref:protein LSM12 homolog A-like n=1 Tax=Clavelina lepadiformis TaxID=159417 RepID=UPI004041F584